MRTEEDERGGRGRAAPTALACIRRAQGGRRGRANGEARGLARGAARCATDGRGRARCSRGGGVGVHLGHRGIVAEQRHGHTAQLLEVLGGEASDEARVVGEAAPAAAWAASAELDSHSKRNGRCENCLPNSLLQQRMLAHTMDRCVLAVEHSFGCGTMRMHWKLQSVRPTPTTSTATQESTAVSGTKSKCLLVLQRTCGTRHDLHLCEHRQLSTLKSHRPSDVCHIKSAAQRTTERDAVFWFVPQQTGGTAHRRERGGFPVCTATNWWCSPAISDSRNQNNHSCKIEKP